MCLPWPVTTNPALQGAKSLRKLKQHRALWEIHSNGITLHSSVQAEALCLRLTTEDERP
jgi:hypothetical protein